MNKLNSGWHRLISWATDTAPSKVDNALIAIVAITTAGGVLTLGLFVAYLALTGHLGPH